MENFKKQYRDLEQRVLRKLRDLVDSSTHISIHTGAKAVEVNVCDYRELTTVNDQLTFLDSAGLHYSVFTDCGLEDLIDILNAK